MQMVMKTHNANMKVK